MGKNMASKKGLSVKKHVNAVHIRGELSLLQRKLANALLYHAYPLLPSQDTYEIRVAALCDLIGYDSNDWKSLKEALSGLSSVVIEWGVRENDKTRIWGVFSMLAEAQIDFKSGICRYSYGPVLREKLYNPEIYATINLDIQKKFGSKYALALYENCVRYRQVGSTGWMAMEVFRQLVGCSDQPAYSEFRRLSEKIIKPAVREVNETSDIELTPEYKRESRKVSSVRMKIADKRDLPPLRSKRGKTQPAEDAARVSAVVDEIAERERLAQEKAAAAKALQEMKAMLAKPAPIKEPGPPA